MNLGRGTGRESVDRIGSRSGLESRVRVNGVPCCVTNNRRNRDTGVHFSARKEVSQVGRSVIGDGEFVWWEEGITMVSDGLNIRFGYRLDDVVLKSLLDNAGGNQFWMISCVKVIRLNDIR